MFSQISKVFEQIGGGFSALKLREQVIAVAAVAVCIVLAINLLLIKPQLVEINRLRGMELTHQKALVDLRRIVIEIKKEADLGIDPFAQQRAQVAEYRTRITAAEALGVNDAGGSSEIGILVRRLIADMPGLTLMSLKTMPGSVFYTPPSAPAAPKEGVKTEIDRLMASIKGKESSAVQAQGVVLVNKPIYRHGVEVSVKGRYPALVAYMEEMKKSQRRIYWADVTLDAKNYREAVLKLVVYTLSDQITLPLN